VKSLLQKRFILSATMDDDNCLKMGSKKFLQLVTELSV
jgi:hypothetical protein